MKNGGKLPPYPLIPKKLGERKTGGEQDNLKIFPQIDFERW